MKIFLIVLSCFFYSNFAFAGGEDELTVHFDCGGIEWLSGRNGDEFSTFRHQININEFGNDEFFEGFKAEGQADYIENDVEMKDLVFLDQESFLNSEGMGNVDEFIGVPRFMALEFLLKKGPTETATLRIEMNLFNGPHHMIYELIRPGNPTKKEIKEISCENNFELKSLEPLFKELLWVQSDNKEDYTLKLDVFRNTGPYLICDEKSNTQCQKVPDDHAHHSFINEINEYISEQPDGEWN